MSLWIPKDTGRPLWAQRRFPSGDVGDRFLLSPIALDHCKTEKQEDGRLPQWKEVLSVAAGSLEEAYLWMTAAVREANWDPLQGEADASTGQYSGRSHLPQAG